MSTEPRDWLSNLALLTVLLAIGVAGCSGTGLRGDRACAVPSSPDLGLALAEARDSLSSGCEYRFNDYYDALLAIGENDPDPDNKRRFSEFLVWAEEEGLVSKRQAQLSYNRYFNVKFTSLMGDYNTCSQACPDRRRVIADMEQELRDKERGLLRVAGDPNAYYRADLLFKETELVLEATCLACEGGR